MSSGIQVTLLRDTARLPTQGTTEAAGANTYCDADFTIPPWSRHCVPTGIAAQPPPGHYLQLYSRSSMAWHHGILVAGGVIDRDYTGEIKVILCNHSDEAYHARAGDRIAQMVCHKIAAPVIKDVTSNIVKFGRGDTSSNRDCRSFGSTGR